MENSLDELFTWILIWIFPGNQLTRTLASLCSFLYTLKPLFYFSYFSANILVKFPNKQPYLFKSMRYLWNLVILLTSPNNYKHISKCNLVLASPSDYKSNYTFKPCCKTNHNTQNKMSFWMAGSSQATRTELSKTSVFTRQIPIYWVTNRLQSSPYGVDKYNCWGCCAVIMKAGKEARRSPVMIVFGLHCLPIKIISCIAWSLAADNSMLPHMLFFFPRSFWIFLRVVESLVFPIPQRI